VEEEAAPGVAGLQAILQTVQRLLSPFGRVLGLLSRQSPSAVLRQFRAILDRMGRPATGAAGTGPGAANDGAKGANPGPARTVPAALLVPAAGPVPEASGLDTVLWDQGIVDVLQERVAAGSGFDVQGDGAFWASACLVTGLRLARSELGGRPRTNVRVPRKPRCLPRTRT
jgi:hypothetical protein